MVLMMTLKKLINDDIFKNRYILGKPKKIRLMKKSVHCLTLGVIHLNP